MKIITSGLKILGATVQDVFGSPVKPPGPTFDNPVEGLARVVITGIRLTLISAGFMVLIYLLWGALDWINSGGDKENLQKAQQKITNALIGIVILVAVLGGFSVITGDVLGIIRKTEDGRWIFGIPTIQSCVQYDDICNSTDKPCCSPYECTAGTCQGVSDP